VQRVEKNKSFDSRTIASIENQRRLIQSATARKQLQWLCWFFRCASILLCFSVGFGQTAAQGDIVAFLETIVNAMPDAGSNKFVIPQNSDLTYFQTVFTSLKSKNYSSIVAQAASYNYTFYQYADSSSNDTLYVLKEDIPVQRGWGTYIFNPHGTNEIMIECPHPIYDTRSWKLGIKVFLRLDANWFAMAGTNRNANTDQSSDMAHVTQAVFHTAHTTIAAPTAIQIHGFAKSNHPGYPDVVISNGTLYPPPILYTLETNYEEQSFTAGVYSLSTWSSLMDLGATSNTQGQWSNANGKTFVHIEHDTPLRTDNVKLAKVVEALYNTFTPPTFVSTNGFVHLSDFRLEQNYPNPFNPETVIRYELPVTSSVKLAVFDLLGREVGVLVNEYTLAGTHTVKWDAKGMSSGPYFYTLTTAGQMQTKMMLLIK